MKPSAGHPISPKSRAVATDDLKSLPLPEVEKKLESSPDGLTQAEAQKRLTQYGPNEIEEKKSNELLKFLSYFWGPIPWMIEAAVILSAVARHWPDFGIILLLLLANAVVGFWEEHQAGNAIAALKATLAIKARVKRDGKPLFDPPREDAKATIATARQMGVKVKMVTGDALAIAQETAKKLGMGTNLLDASGFGDTNHQETAQLAKSIENADGFAQVFPEHKFHIVDVLQKRDHIVGMTGDGVNDAPALKKADCGIAVSSATDAARAAASIVLLA